MRRNLALYSAFLIWLLLGLSISPLRSATFTVNTEEDDDGPCTIEDCALREAILAANAMPGKDTIVIPAGTYQQTLIGMPGEGESLTGSFDLRDDVELLGDENGMARIVGDGTDRVFSVTECEVLFSRLVITGGFREALGIGAGILIGNSRVTIKESTIENNVTLNEGGGGIFAFDSEVFLIDSAVLGNFATLDGGGIDRFGLDPRVNSNMTLINTTVSGNSSDQGGGIESTGHGNLILINSTIVDNSARVGSAVLMDFSTASPILTNTLISGSCFFADGGDTISLGGNIESPGSTCFLTDPTDRMGVPDPLIGPLTTTASSPTPFHPLLPGSPAIDSAVDAECPMTDQRGRGRPLDGDGDRVARCDVGAIEVAPGELVADIPVLGSWGWLVLVSGLGVFGWRRLRKGGSG